MTIRTYACSISDNWQNISQRIEQESEHAKI
jgi:DNA-directed RNA polymerase subunit N (RpoN/RPB10)